MKTAKAFVIALLVVGGLLSQVGFLKNTTPSLPYRYFIWLPHIKPHIGDITTFVHPVYGRLIKRMIGVEDNVVAYDEEGVIYVGGVPRGKLYTHNKQGRFLQPLPAGVIPKGYVFCVGDHPESMDSRYAAIGLVKVERLQGRLWGIW